MNDFLKTRRDFLRTGLLGALATWTVPAFMGRTFAEMDQGIPPEQVERFAATLDSLGIDNDIHIYDDVNHGFWLWVDRDPETAAAPAADAWTRLKAYLARVLS